MKRHIVAALVVISCLHLRGAGVAYSEQSLAIPTYKVGEPSKVPFFYRPEYYQCAQLHVYPYPFQGTSLADKPVDAPYKGLILENEFIKLCVLPELGGRWYYAIDKTNGQNFIYRNNVVKPALVGMTGAWFSGGVEWNIPHHHRASTFMPVDHTVEEHADGSKTVWVGEYEKRNETRWMVGLTLRPGRAAVEVTMKLFNTTPYQQSLLMWANAAVAASPDYRVIFPPDVNAAYFHEKMEYTEWPLSRQMFNGIDFTKGVDVSWWRNAPLPVSFFAHGSKMDFIGGYDYGRRAGTVLVGDHYVFPGKKFWNWGNNHVQRMWDKMLTDTDGPYLELMMGLYADDQPDYSWNQPYGLKEGTMYFLPVKEMGGLKQANHEFALNLERVDQSIRFDLNAASAHRALTAEIRSGDRVIASESLSVDPLHPFSKRYAATNPGRLSVRVLDDKGAQLIAYTEPPAEKAQFPEPYRRPAPPKELSGTEELYFSGLRLEQFGNYLFDPEKYWAEALQRDAANSLVNTQAGVFHLKRGDNATADPYLRKAIERVTMNVMKPLDASPLYYLGVSLFEQGRNDEAYEWLYKAAWDNHWTAPAYYHLALIASQRGQASTAIAHLRRALENNANHIDALHLLAALLRKSDAAESRQLVSRVLALDPLNLNAAFERYVQAGRSADAAAAIERAYRDEPYNYIETAARYGNAGLFEDALGVLQLAKANRSPAVRSFPMVSYIEGHYRLRQGDETNARAAFQRAAQQPHAYCFPYGKVSETALRDAMATNPQDAMAHYYLGCVYGDYQPQRAVAHFRRATELKPGFDLAHRNLAYLYGNALDNVDEAVRCIDQAIAANRREPMYLLESDLYREYRKDAPADRLAVLQRHADVVRNYDKSLVRQADLLATVGRYDEAIELLTKHRILVAEQTSLNPHLIWADAHLYRGLTALESKRYEQASSDFREMQRFPENLQTANDPKVAVADYWLGVAAKETGDEATARRHWEQLAAVVEGNKRGWGFSTQPVVAYYRGMALQQLGRDEEAKAMFEELIRKGDQQLATPLHAGRDMTSIFYRLEVDEITSKAEFMAALGHKGLGDDAKCRERLKRALAARPGYTDVIQFMKM